MNHQSFSADIKGILAKKSLKQKVGRVSLRSKLSPVEKIMKLVKTGYLKKER